MSTRIQEAVTFIKATREEAITLAHDAGDAEVHALHLQKGFSAPAQQPVGYMVVPVKRWVGLTLEEVEDIIKSNVTITDPNLYEAVYAAAVDIEHAVLEKNK